MAIPVQDDLDLGKVSKLLGALLEQGNTATIDAALTALGQIGYDTTILRAKIHDGISVKTLLQDTDIDSDPAFTTPSDSKVPSVQAMVTYIGNLLAGGTRIRGSVTLTSASTYPVATAASYTNGTQLGNGSGVANAIKAGDAWYVGNTSSFQMGLTATHLVSAGDLVIALTDGATNLDANWLVLQDNIDIATTTLSGSVLLATLAQIRGNAGGDANKAVTVSGLNSFLAAPEIGDLAAKFTRGTSITQTLNSGANTVTHNKGVRVSDVTFINATTNAHTVMGWTNSTVNAITVSRAGGSQSFIIKIRYDI